jgi:hypothetical protein
MILIANPLLVVMLMIGMQHASRNDFADEDE